MINRHRLPNVFSIYMVDVLCCALGCVVLLWLINFREARDRTLAAAETSKRLQRTQSELEESTSDRDAKNIALLDALRREKDLGERFRNLSAEKDRFVDLAGKTKQALDTTSIKLRDVDTRLKDTLAKLEDTSNKLADSNSQLADTTDWLKEKTQQFADASDKLKGKTQELDKTRLALKESETREADLRDTLALLTLDRNKLEMLAGTVKKEYQATLFKLQATLGQLADLKLDYKSLEETSTKTSGDLDKTIKENSELAQQIASLSLFLDKSKKELNEKTARNAADAKELQALTDRLLKSSDFTKELQEQLSSLRVDLKTHQAKVTAAGLAAIKTKKDCDDLQNRIQELQVAKLIMEQKLNLTDKDLETAKRVIGSLQGENLTLLKRTQLVQEAARNRFAGITLTGQRIVFVIDMSGSMALEDADSADPDKWPLLCESVGKIMRSMPNLEKYQVILFSDKTSYPLGRNGLWIDYDPEDSARQTVDQLKKVTPAGATNMYDALAEAFRFRASGLDTMYVFSDGLPTEGEGLPGNTQLTTTQKTDALSKHVRNTLKTVWNRQVSGMPQVRINTIGFFFESPEVGAFLWALSRENDGSFVGMSKQ